MIDCIGFGYGIQRFYRQKKLLNVIYEKFNNTLWGKFVYEEFVHDEWSKLDKKMPLNDRLKQIIIHYEKSIEKYSDNPFCERWNMGIINDLLSIKETQPNDTENIEKYKKKMEYVKKKYTTNEYTKLDIECYEYRFKGNKINANEIQIKINDFFNDEYFKKLDEENEKQKKALKK